MKNLRIVIFEDDQALASMLKLVLSKGGHDVQVFPDPTICPVYRDHETECINGTPCADVIISDYKMPHMTGLDFFKLMRMRGCKAKDENKLLITGSVISAEMKHDIKGLGCCCIKKPFKISKIVNWVDECADREQ